MKSQQSINFTVHRGFYFLRHPSLLVLRTFGFCAISTYNSHFPSIFEKNALNWFYFQNIWKGRFLRSKEAAWSRSGILRLTKIKINVKKKIKYPTLFLCTMTIFLLNRNMSKINATNQIMSTRYQSSHLLTFPDF